MFRDCNFKIITTACFLSLARSKLRLCSANHRAGYFSNLACDWLSIVWAYSELETENGPTSPRSKWVEWQCLPLCNIFIWVKFQWTLNYGWWITGEKLLWYVLHFLWVRLYFSRMLMMSGKKMLVVWPPGTNQYESHMYGVLKYGSHMRAKFHYTFL